MDTSHVLPPTLLAASAARVRHRMRSAPPVLLILNVSPWIATLHDATLTGPCFFTLKHSKFSITTAGAGPQLSVAVALNAIGLSGLGIVAGAMQLMTGAVVSTTFTLTDALSAAALPSTTRR